MSKEAIIVNNKSSAKFTWKRKEQLDIARAIKDYMAEKGFMLPLRSDRLYGNAFPVKKNEQSERAYKLRADLQQEIDKIFQEEDQQFNHAANYGKHLRRKGQSALSFDAFTEKAKAKMFAEKWKAMRKDYRKDGDHQAMRFFTDRETGEFGAHYDEYIELAKAYYTLRDSSPAVYAIFKHRKNDHYLKQLVAMSCSRHRLDPVWNFQKSKLIRGIWYRFLEKTRIHEQHQPMHLMLTVPHTNGQWKGKAFYAREFIEKFNIMRKYPGWKRCIYGGEYGIEVSRKGSSGLHIHLHSLVFQKKQFRRDVVNRYIRMIWHRLTGAQVTWYETLYIHRKDENGKYIMEASDDGVPILDKSGRYTDDINGYSLETDGIRGKKKKFYLDDGEEWFTSLSPEDKLKSYLSGVMECIKYHFKIDCFKKGRHGWDVDLMKDVLRHSKGLRMYSKYGAFYREKELNYSRIEKPEEKDLQAELDAQLATFTPQERTDEEKERVKVWDGVNEFLQMAASGNVSTDHLVQDGIADRIINPYTRQPAKMGEYIVALSLPEKMTHYGKQRDYQPIISNMHHEGYFKIKPFVSLRRILSSIMKQTTQRESDHPFKEIMVESDYLRWRESGWSAPRERLFV